MNKVLDDSYLPFTKEQLLHHFTKIRKRNKCVSNDKRQNYYRKSIKKYHRFLANKQVRKGMPLSKTKSACQIEKDERFWIASCMMTIFYDEEREKMLQDLFTQAFGKTPPVLGLDSWQECLEGNLELYFEAILPSPTAFKTWLSGNLEERHFIPYVINGGFGKVHLEGPTHLDALLINPNNGFSVVIEAKVLSDISYQITYDTTRNQIARIIDVMLERNDKLCEPLNKRDPDRTLFLLLTPEIFKINTSLRLYGYKFTDYKKNPDSIAADLPHRTNQDWRKISQRLGWLTWEDFRRVNKDCCPWLSK